MCNSATRRRRAFRLRYSRRFLLDASVTLRPRASSFQPLAQRSPVVIADFVRRGRSLPLCKGVFISSYVKKCKSSKVVRESPIYYCFLAFTSLDR